MKSHEQATDNTDTDDEEYQPTGYPTHGQMAQNGAQRYCAICHMWIGTENWEDHADHDPTRTEEGNEWDADDIKRAASTADDYFHDAEHDAMRAVDMLEDVALKVEEAVNVLEGIEDIRGAAGELLDEIESAAADLEADDFQGERKTIELGGKLYEVRSLGYDIEIVNGIDREAADNLRRAGYWTVDDLSEATREELAEVDGVTEAVADSVAKVHIEAEE